MKWERESPPHDLAVECYVSESRCRVFFAIEHGRWHLSIAHPKRLPTWEEVREARYHFLPDGVLMAMLLPPKEEYVNVHPFCFHLWEIQGEEAAGYSPSIANRRLVVVPGGAA